MQRVTIEPKCKRARNRVREHGRVMLLRRVGTFRGEPAVLVESVGPTWRGEKWVGWLTAAEVDWKSA